MKTLLALPALIDGRGLSLAAREPSIWAARHISYQLLSIDYRSWRFLLALFALDLTLQVVSFGLVQVSGYLELALRLFSPPQLSERHPQLVMRAGRLWTKVYGRA